MSNLSKGEIPAILGGLPVATAPFRPYNSMGTEEIAATRRVVESGNLSGFLGEWGDAFLGGPSIRELEAAWCDRFGVTHAVTVNSATSGLVAALGAAGVAPGDEVIVPPYTMSATAVAPLAYGGIPVFADIEPSHFCLDPASVKMRLTARTRAIITVNLFGHPSQLKELRSLADAHGILLIEDNAQASLAREGEQLCGTIGHIGVFSLNVHKHIHTGEGGVNVTDDAQLALKMQLIRNHGENAVDPLGLEGIDDVYGFNLRMTELTAAVAIEQLKKIDHHVGARISIAEVLTDGVAGLEGLGPPDVREGCTHVYCAWVLHVDEKELGISRETFSKALVAEGIPHNLGYVRPLYLLPIFQKRISTGRDGLPSTLRSPDYRLGSCPVAERMHFKELLVFPTAAYATDSGFAESAVTAISKLHSKRHLLREA